MLGFLVSYNSLALPPHDSLANTLALTHPSCAAVWVNTAWIPFICCYSLSSRQQKLGVVPIQNIHLRGSWLLATWLTLCLVKATMDIYSACNWTSK